MSKFHNFLQRIQPEKSSLRYFRSKKTSISNRFQNHIWCPLRGQFFTEITPSQWRFSPWKSSPWRISPADPHEKSLKKIPPRWKFFQELRLLQNQDTPYLQLITTSCLIKKSFSKKNGFIRKKVKTCIKRSTSRNKVKTKS